MSAVTILLVTFLCIVVATGIAAAVIDLSKISSRALDKRRARRACRRGWDWPAFEREVARYIRGHDRRPHATPPHG